MIYRDMFSTVAVNCLVFFLVGKKDLTDAQMTISVPVASNIYSLKVNGSVSKVMAQISIVFDNQTWFQAEYKCQVERKMGYLDHAHRGFRRWAIVGQALREHNITHHTFWHGTFRPYDEVAKWDDVRCSGTQYDVSNSWPMGEKQCAVVEFGDSYGQPVIKPANCLEKHPYICRELLDGAKIYLYKGFGVISTQNNFKPIVFKNSTLENCIYICLRVDEVHIGMTFSYSTNECIIYKIFPGFGYAEYTIGRSKDNITHGVKLGSYPVYTINQTAPNSNVINKFPNCGVTPFPDNYCIVMTSEDAANMAKDISKNLIVKRESTSKYRRRFVCANDERGSSKTCGGLAVIFISAVFSLPIVSDLLSFHEYKAKQKLRRQSGDINLPDVLM